MDNDIVKFLPLGGIGDVTKNLYIYEYQDQILIVDCGLGFADETMLGVDLLMPDASYLAKTKKRIVGMLITHGHEDHMGALPFVLPQLPNFPIFATPFTAALANEKLKEFGTNRQIQPIQFGMDQEIKLGAFSASFIRVTHSIPDTAHILIKTPVGNFYHGSDYKFDLTPYDGKKTDFAGIVAAGNTGIIAMMSDCLGSERQGITPSEEKLTAAFDQEVSKCTGKCLVTTYASNIGRLSQIIHVAQKYNRQVCFVGRSLLKAVDVGKKTGLLTIPKNMEVRVDQVKKIKDTQLLLIVAGSQGQENSAMTRIATGEHKDVTLRSTDTVIFSADPIPGNEVMVNTLIDAISKVGARVMYSDITRDFHVSGHGSSHEVMMLMNLVRPKFVVPISGTYKQMVAYKGLARKQGYTDKQILLMEDGQEMLFRKNDAIAGQKIPVRNVYVDEISGEELESFVLHDRQQLSSDGLVVVMVEVDSENGGMLSDPEVIGRGFSPADAQEMRKILSRELKKVIYPTQNRTKNWSYVRKQIVEVSEKAIMRELRRKPLVLPVVIEL